MKLTVTDNALNWFKEEVELESGNKVRFIVQIYGDSKIREGYSLAFTLDKDDRKKQWNTKKTVLSFISMNLIYGFLMAMIYQLNMMKKKMKFCSNI